jgi:hypothetical protein
VSGLRLKIIGHHGAFLRQTIAGREQVAGPDVILAHRLLKNGLARHDDYALLTRSAVESMGVDPARAGLAARTERYEHFGEISCFVLTARASEGWRAEAVEQRDPRPALA